MIDNFFLKLPTLTTERLILRKLTYSDKEAIFEYAKNPEVAKYVLWDAHESLSDTIDYLNIVYAAYNNNKPAPWGIQLKDDNQIIGTAGFIDLKIESNSAEIGYALSFNHWNKGITTEAVKEIVKIGFDSLNLDEITARCIAENHNSKRVLLKCGFEHQKHQTMGMKVKGEFADLDFFSLTRNKYNNLKLDII